MRNFFIFMVFILLTAALPQGGIRADGAARGQGHFLTLNYHRINKSYFSRQMKMLKDKGFNFIGIGEVMDFYYRDKPLPEKSVLITFPGTRENFSNARPAIEKLAIKALVFLNVREIKERNYHYVSWHDVDVMTGSKSWDMAISAKGADEAIESKKYLEGRLKGFKVEAVRLPAGADTEKIEGRFFLSFIQKAGDKLNTADAPRYRLNMLAVSPRWDASDLSRYLENLSSRKDGYRDEFESGDITRDWLVSWGKAYAKDGKLNLEAKDGQSGAEIWLTGTDGWDDASIELDFDLSRGEQFWVYARYKDRNNYLRFGRDGNNFYLQQHAGEKKIAGVKSQEIKAKPGVFQKVRLVVRGGYAAAYLEDKRLFEQPLFIDSSLKTGRIGFSAWDKTPASASCRVERVDIRPLDAGWAGGMDFAGEENTGRESPGSAKIQKTAESIFSYFKDNKGRQVIKAGEKISYRLGGGFSFEPAYSRVFLKEETAGKIRENEYSLSALYENDFKSLRLTYTYRDFSAVNPAHNYLLETKSPFLFLDSISLVSGYENVETARAVRAKVRMFRNAISILEDNLPFDFNLYAKYQSNRYIDDNQRNIFRFFLSRVILRRPNLSAGYDFTYDDTGKVSPDYYSPQGLNLHQVRFRSRDKLFNKKLFYDIGYAFGTGSEKGESGRLSQSAESSLTFKVNEALEISLKYNFSRTPSYRSGSTGLRLKYRF